ncbi:ParB/RepB/Spo0J family partition protein [Ruania alkalisoli]|uniref:ParB/RepB/Spo0J family partition protein n=1 Tax=Ruania alkalisoli TaxID=2779775 RepID=A0A7M1SVU9_9MICO|nr:ParB/RepB/Spo0J family partition protein [Ruania alkalisoli]QOR70753.1 ParB/RepB/Spo0J family partition protein [Ruania alkalisoli]
MTERRRGLGRGLGALIPTGTPGGGQRPVDVFFPEQEKGTTDGAKATDTASSAEKAVPNDAPLSTSERLLAELEEQATAPAPATSATGTNSSPSGTAAALAGTEAAPDAPTQPDANGLTGAGSTPRPTDPVLDSGAVSPDGEAADPDGLVAVPGARFAEVPIEAIAPNALQPRQVFDDDELNELASSIREVGVLQPVVVRPSGADADGFATYELIMGERRWRASRIAGQTTVPAIIRDTAQDDMLRDALLENLHRVQLNPLEEAAAYQQLLDDFDCTHDELATRIARSRPQISNTLRLLKLPALVQRRVAAGVLSAGHARALLGLPDGAAMERLAQRIVAEGLSVRATEEIVTLGEDPLQPELRRRPRAGAHSAALGELASRLSDRLDTKVKVNLGQRKGHVSIEFASVQDLNRILGVLDPNDPGVLREDGSVAEAE